MVCHGQIINPGEVTAEAVVLDAPFSFIGDFDPETGCLNLPGKAHAGVEVAGKVLVIPTGKGGTIAPWIAYAAAQNGKAPAAILCQHPEPITCEAAITIDIPMLVSFDQEIVAVLKTGQMVSISGNRVETTGA